MLGFSSAVAQRGAPSSWDAVIRARAQGDPHVLALTKAIIAHESEWNPNAVNPADPSYGLMQILHGPGGPYPSVTVQQLRDPVTNIELGMDFLLYQLGRYPLLEDAIAAYNAGTPRRNAAGLYVNSTGSTQVQDYVDDVLMYFDWYQANDPLVATLGPSPAASSTDVDLTVAGGGPSPADEYSADAGALGGGAVIALGILAAVVVARLAKGRAR